MTLTVKRHITIVPYKHATKVIDTMCPSLEGVHCTLYSVQYTVQQSFRCPVYSEYSIVSLPVLLNVLIACTSNCTCICTFTFTTSGPHQCIELCNHIKVYSQSSKRALTWTSILQMLNCIRSVLICLHSMCS